MILNQAPNLFKYFENTIKLKHAGLITLNFFLRIFITNIKNIFNIIITYSNRILEKFVKLYTSNRCLCAVYPALNKLNKSIPIYFKIIPDAL